MLIYVCDDEQKILSDIVDKTRECCPQSSIIPFSTSKELLNSFALTPCDIILLDIDMPEMSGHDVAKEIRKTNYKPLIIFVTSHDELVYDSLDFHPFGFVRKSYFDSEIEKILEDAFAELVHKNQYFIFKIGSENIKLPISKILYIESDGNYLRIITDTNEYRIRDTISNVLATLSLKGFVRTHRGFIVNQSHVRKIGSCEVQITNGTLVPIGRYYYETAKKQLVRFLIK